MELKHCGDEFWCDYGKDFESNQCGIETTMIVWKATAKGRPLNRTNVELKHDANTLHETDGHTFESNQCGIETVCWIRL